ncbi:hypothetical protein ASE37_15285 [Rhizobium sp. Root268]|nr:hypothetical protein ASC86_15295 [Rhizobium sp. Root1212]KRD23683.1 hypothetical protein ASE37_15285 [Rhizobium sp. Root268]
MICSGFHLLWLQTASFNVECIVHFIQSSNCERSAQYSPQQLRRKIMREPFLQIGDFAIWTLILGSVIGYQLWTHSDPAPLTTAFVMVAG